MRTPTDTLFFTGTADHWQNLLWALSTSDIAPDFPLPWLPAERRSALLGYFSTPHTDHPLTRQLNIFLEKFSNRRLGVYFENLWAFAFKNHPDYTLLARNLPIRSDGRTLGELDFLVHYHPDNTVEHWELAVKFYLQVGEAWVGPGLRDRLDIKLARMREHQLPIIHNPQAQSQLAKSQMTPQRQWALMPGRLFVPLPKNSSQVPHHWWGTLEQFQEALPQEDKRWRLLRKLDWLAQPAASTLESSYTGEELFRVLPDHLEARGPVCVEPVTGEKMRNRGFIVPANWYREALSLLTPPSETR